MTQNQLSNPIARVLVIEDEIMAKTAAKFYLNRLNCEVDIAGNGAEAFEKIANLYKFIICDLGLPDIGGLEIARFIRKYPGAIGSIPIVILTAHGNNVQREQAYHMGLNGFLIKPLTEELCSEMIKNFVLSPVDKNYFLEN